MSEVRARPSPRAQRLAAVVTTVLVLLCGLTLGACGGGSSVSDVVPKRTPDITPPTDTSAEKAAAQTTSTATTSTTSKTSTGEGSSSESASGEAEKSESEEAPSGEGSSGSGSSGAAGGTSAGEKEKATGKGGEAANSPTGGAGAP